VLREQIDLDGIPVHVADTAGIRETSDVIEAEGIRRARKALESADIVLLIRDASEGAAPDDGLYAEIPDGVRTITVANKIDLLPPGTLRQSEQADAGNPVWISARTGSGIDVLRKRILQVIGASEPAEGAFSARQRHVDALKRAGCHLAEGFQALERYQAGELLAEELRLAQQALGEITGEMLPNDLLGEIFSSFCIGK
jgi:tRNA modification GTPase